MKSLDDKIRAFLKMAGHPCDEDFLPALHLLCYFEQLYDCRVLDLLVSEWWEEQRQLDLSREDFGRIREHLPTERHEHFEQVVSEILQAA